MKVQTTIHPGTGVWINEVKDYEPILECMIADGIEVGRHIDRNTLLTLLQGRTVQERMSLYHAARLLINAMHFIGLQQ